MPISAREVKEMRKVNIGVFTVIIVLLFYLSTVSNVAATEWVNHIDMKSTVSATDPGYTLEFIVNVPPVSGRWTLSGIGTDEDVVIKSKCYWENNLDPADISPWSGPSGYHYFRIHACYYTHYYSPGIEKWTYAGQSGSDWDEVTVPDCNPYTSIFVEYIIVVENLYSETGDDDEYAGYIDLLP